MKEYPKYADVVIKLQDIQIRPSQDYHQDTPSEPAAAFASLSTKKPVHYWPCKNHRYLGTSYDEKDCYHEKKRQQQQQEANIME